MLNADQTSFQSRNTTRLFTFLKTVDVYTYIQFPLAMLCVLVLLGTAIIDITYPLTMKIPTLKIELYVFEIAAPCPYTYS
jgi:hypothetical protein